MINIINCPCPRKKCKRHGDCDSCRNHHRDKKRVVYCERKAKRGNYE